MTFFTVSISFSFNSVLIKIYPEPAIGIVILNIFSYFANAKTGLSIFPAIFLRMAHQFTGCDKD